MSSLGAKIRYRQRTATQGVRQISSFTAPILGWNARDSLDDMDPRYALVLDNYFPDGSDVRVRGGSVDHVTGFVGPVEFLHTAAFGTNRKLIAFANNSSYDATGGGTVGPSLGTGFSNNRWTGVNAGASGGERALYTNGVDAAQSYDGSTWQAAGLTGPTKPIGITIASNKRLWVIENGTGEAWYSPPEAVTGALSKFDIGSVHPEGGNLVAIGSLSIDGGEGPDDYTVFVMRSGAVVVYRGTDPSDAALWALVGVWKAGNPIGERCLVPYDKDLLIITDVGFQSILRFTTGGGLSGVPISDNIRRAVSDAARDYYNNYGWNGIYHPTSRELIFNIPILQASTTDQFVMNSISGAWCRYRSLNALCHAIRENNHYIGRVGKVMQADVGGVDGDQPILGKLQTAWSYVGSRGQPKHFKQMRVKFRSDTDVSLSLALGTDFVDPIPQRTEGSAGETNIATWDESNWDEDFWGGGLVTTGNWVGAFKRGLNASIVAQTETAQANVQYLSADLLYEREII